MKKVITTVGTSLFTNYLKKSDSIKEDWNRLKDRPAGDYKKCEDRIKSIKSKVNPHINMDLDDASAETKSIIKLKQNIDDCMDVYLLASDTLLSIVAAELISNVCFDDHINCHFNDDNDVIKGLQVSDDEKFRKEGMTNLLSRIYSITEGYFGNVIINITGGFKATIPFLTIFGQVNGIPLYYIFEDTDNLISIPQAPLSIDWKSIKENEKLFLEVDRERVKEIPGFNNPMIESMFERIDDLISLNSLGVIFWEKYKSMRMIIFVHCEAKKKYEELKRDDKIIIEKSLIELSKRIQSNPNDRDLRHSLANCPLPDQFYCFKHKEENRQVRILWHSRERETSYGAVTCDIYVASFWRGSEVHNAESEYIEEIRRYTEKNKNIVKELDKFMGLSLDKEEVTNV